MLFPDLCWKAFQDPRVHQCFLGCYSLARLPDEELLYEIYELFVLTCAENELDWFGVRPTDLSLAFWFDLYQVSIKEFMRSRAAFYKGGGRNAKDLHEHQHLLLLALARKDRESQEELAENAAHRPNINGICIRHSDDYLRRSVKPTLDVCVNLILLEAPRTEIYNLDTRFVLLF